MISNRLRAFPQHHELRAYSKKARSGPHVRCRRSRNLPSGSIDSGQHRIWPDIRLDHRFHLFAEIPAFSFRRRVCGCHGPNLDRRLFASRQMVGHTHGGGHLNRRRGRDRGGEPGHVRHCAACIRYQLRRLRRGYRAYDCDGVDRCRRALPLYREHHQSVRRSFRDSHSGECDCDVVTIVGRFQCHSSAAPTQPRSLWIRGCGYWLDAVRQRRCHFAGRMGMRKGKNGESAHPGVGSALPTSMSVTARPWSLLSAS